MSPAVNCKMFFKRGLRLKFEKIKVRVALGCPTFENKKEKEKKIIKGFESLDS